jgi:O-acetyl-ADP-ribose deacetylase (regulator of RNase III)
MTLKYLIGDATEPIIKPALICHICNDCQPGAWGAGFVLALSRKNKAPQKSYHSWSIEGASGGYKLGAIKVVPFAENVWVANMIAQKGICWERNVPPIRYDALETCLISAYKYAENNGLTVAGPRFGADLAGGSWERIEAIIKKVMTVDTYIYTLESQKDRWPTQYEK